MDLFSVVHLEMPREVTIGVRPLGEGETPVMQATQGRVVDLHIPEAEGSPQAINAPPVQAVPPHVQPEPAAEQPPPAATIIPVVDVGDSEEEMEEELPLRKRAAKDDGVESSKRPRVEAGASSASGVPARYLSYPLLVVFFIK